MPWNDLSMTERARYILLGVSNGITDLSVIRDTYNKYDDRGYIDQLVSNVKDVIKKTKDKVKNSVNNNIKDSAYSIMVDDSGRTGGAVRDLNFIINALANRDSIVNTRRNIDRNLASLYIYGNDLGQFTEAPELVSKGVDYTNYLKSIGRDPSKVKTYKGNTVVLDFFLPEDSRDILPMYIASHNNKSLPAFLVDIDPDTEDDLAGFLLKLDLDSNGNPILVNSDLWNFEPTDYAKYYTNELSYIPTWLEAKALDMIGNPFILKSLQPVDFVDLDTFYDRYKELSPAAENISKDLGYLPELIVKPK